MLPPIIIQLFSEARYLRLSIESLKFMSSFSYDALQ